MKVPSFLQGERPYDMVKGAIGGAVLTMIVGFALVGWTLGSTAKASRDTAVTAALVSACPDLIRAIPAAVAALKTKSPGDYDDVVKEHLPMIGTTKTDYPVWRLCGYELASQQKAELEKQEKAKLAATPKPK